MARSLMVLVVGVLLGVVATLLLRPGPLALPDLGDLQPATEATVPPAAAVVSAAARDGGPAFYLRLADDNTSELAAMIRQAAAEPKSTERELALAVLLKRYSELDALGAVRLARDAGVNGMALSAVYGAWARKAPGQALAALSTVESAEAAATVAIALIEALGDDATAVRRVGAVLAARRDDDPASGMAPAAPFFTPAGPAPFALRSALALTAQRWADLDPRRAVAVAREVGDERLRLALESAALRALARTAPDEAFAHLATLDSASRQLGALGGTLIDLARADPERLLAAVAGLPADARRPAESAALQQLSERDPLAAVRYVEQMRAGPERDQMTQVIARNYGKRDAEAALAWARSQPGRNNLVASVIAGVADQDLNRALDLVLALPPIERDNAVQFVAMTAARQDADVEAIANRLVALDDSQLRDSMAFNVVSMWAMRSPGKAMGWLVAKGESAPPNVFMQIGHQLAMRDPRDAMTYTSQVPAAARGFWMHGIAQGYAQNDPQGAVDWLAQFRGEEWHDQAAATVAMQVAQQDPSAAARLVDGLDTARVGWPAGQLSSNIAMQWANREPVAAAAWALDRPTEPERAMAMQGVLNVWAGQDADAARQWALGLPQSATRDRALTTLLTATARTQRALDARVLNGFASETAQQQAVLQVVQFLAYVDAPRARATVDAHLTDPALREQAERALEAARDAPHATIGFGFSQAPAQVVRSRPR